MEALKKTTKESVRNADLQPENRYVT